MDHIVKTTADDGIGDLEEIKVGNDGFITDPRKADTDGDRLPDNIEIAFGFDRFDSCHRETPVLI